MKTKLLFSIITVLALTACNSKPIAITYGEDACYFCKMTIVDRQHAAEIVTKKGKVYKFDATECMVNFTSDIDSTTIKRYLSNNYLEPEILIDASKATFLISKNIPSPMGAFISAFKTKDEALKMKAKKEGEIYSWHQLVTKIKN